jgi:hypothetical protein
MDERVVLIVCRAVDSIAAGKRLSEAKYAVQLRTNQRSVLAFTSSTSTPTYNDLLLYYRQPYTQLAQPVHPSPTRKRKREKRHTTEPSPT